eukprot:CAMPEP_0201564098 /NCGR_PEP_ID=MMETSP0190_2-20130828/2035_1 /ASSEMBLY_ACC=CAM_ASM_000263 /TAXON_ID=37353 /ORGANISM="Rosalina sp." /LENGTH=606 /DNA_ID=CAMNT_0047979789 /DNA_START=209 /DNA_END=2029 /DNA_ORIENTATION=+
MDENAIRASWKTGAHCQIYSNSKKKWFQGEVAQIFTDEEGEWLEVRYDKSMSKQVQRYSSDIRPHPDDLKKKKTKTKSKDGSVPFPDQEMKGANMLEKERQLRQGWDKGDEVEIFSNTHQEWYLGEVVDIIKDDEGEWLNCVWARANGEAMSKQVQRFSTDVRPVQDDNSSSGSSSDDGPSPKNSQSKPQSAAEKTQALSQKIQARKQNFRRRAPPFSRTLRPSTFTYPATSSARRSRKLLDLEETLEKNQHVADQMPVSHSKGGKRIDIESMKPNQVREFIRSLGKAYERYASKFKSVTGRDLLKYNETALTKIVSAKLHRNKILLEISKNSPSNQYSTIFNNDVDVLNWNVSKVKEWCSKTQFISMYAQKMYNHGIDGMLLFELDSKDLTTIGVKKIHQQRVLDIIMKFAKVTFPSSPKDDEKETESDLNGNSLQLTDDNEAQPGKRKRGSVAHIDTSSLQYNGVLNGVQNNDAIIYTMGELLLELGQMFKSTKVQDLTTRLQPQLDKLRDNSTHPQMIKRGSLKIDTSPMAANNGNDIDDENDEHALILKMQDRVDTSPTGVDAAWLKTQTGAKGHKRRSSLPYINTNQLEDDDDDDDISDIE